MKTKRNMGGLYIVTDITFQYLNHYKDFFKIAGMCFKLYQVNLFTKNQAHLMMFSRLGTSEKANSFSRAVFSLK